MTTPFGGLATRFGLSALARFGLFACLAVLLVNALGFFIYTLPKSLESRNMNQRLVELRQEVESQRTALEARRESVKTRADNVQDERRFLQEVVVERQPALLETLSEIRQIARDKGVTVPTWNFDEKALKDSELSAFEITIPVQGGYDSLVAFLEGLRRSEHFVAVDELRFTSGEEGQPRLEMKLSAFFRGTSS